MPPQGLPTLLPQHAPTPTSDATHELRVIVNGNNFNSSVNEVESANSTLADVRKTLDQLRKWHYWEVRRQESLKWYLISQIYRRPLCPSHSDLRRLALFFFPSRANGIKVEICDFGDRRFERCDTTIDRLESCQSRSILIWGTESRPTNRQQS